MKFKTLDMRNAWEDYLANSDFIASFGAPAPSHLRRAYQQCSRPPAPLDTDLFESRC